MATVKKKVKKHIPTGAKQASNLGGRLDPSLRPTLEPKEWKLTLHRATDARMGFAHEDNFARFGKQHESNVKSFGWVYIPIARAKGMKTLVVTVTEMEPE